MPDFAYACNIYTLPQNAESNPSRQWVLLQFL